MARAYDVHLVGTRGDRAAFASALADCFGIDQTEASAIAERAPVAVKQGVPLELARQYERALIGIGAEVRVVAVEVFEPEPGPGQTLWTGPEQGPAPVTEPAPPRRPRVRVSRGLALLAGLALALGATCLVLRAPRRGGLAVHLEGSRARGAPLVVLLHGYGAPGSDLAGLSRELVAAPGLADVQLVAPAGLERAGFGRAWWTGGGPAPAGLVESRRRLSALVGHYERRGTPRERVFLGGFSQGAVLALDVALRAEPPLGGALVLSGGPPPCGLPPRESWPAEGSFFLSHGRSDRVLPFRWAETTAGQLREAGLEVDFHPFDGGHGIPPEVRTALAGFLARALAEP